MRTSYNYYGLCECCHAATATIMTRGVHGWNFECAECVR